MGISLNKMMTLFLLGLLCTACGTTTLAPELPVESVEKYAYHQEQEGFTLCLKPLSDPAQLDEYFGDNLIKKGLLPVFVVAQNRNSMETYLVSPDSVSANLSTDQDTGSTGGSALVISSVEARKAAHEQDYSGVRLAIIVPVLLPVAFVDWGPTEHSKSVQHNIISKAFRKKVLSPGQSCAGCIYLKLPPGNAYDDTVTIILDIEKLKGGEPLRFSFPVTMPATISKEGKK